MAVKVPTAVLSTTARAKKREADKKAVEKTESSGADAPGPSGAVPKSLCRLFLGVSSAVFTAIASAQLSTGQTLQTGQY